MLGVAYVSSLPLTTIENSWIKCVVRGELGYEICCRSILMCIAHSSRSTKTHPINLGIRGKKQYFEKKCCNQHRRNTNITNVLRSNMPLFHFYFFHVFYSPLLFACAICSFEYLTRCDPLFAHIHFISGKLNLYSLNVCFRQLYGFYLFGFVLPALLLCTSSFSFLLPFSIFLDVYSQSVCFSLSLAHPHQLP